jgi:hypothetical protein
VGREKGVVRHRVRRSNRIATDGLLQQMAMTLLLLLWAVAQ